MCRLGGTRPVTPPEKPGAVHQPFSAQDRAGDGIDVIGALHGIQFRFGQEKN